MKKLLTAILIASTLVNASAASFGRSSSFSSPSVSRSSIASPSISRSSGIGGTSGSMGVRKPEITQMARPNSAPVSSPSYNSNPSYNQPRYTAPAQPTYSAPAIQTPQVSNTSTFLSSMGGAVAGTAIGNLLFGNHGSSNGGGTTVINNTPAPSNGVASSATAPALVEGSAVAPIQSAQHKESSLSMGTIILGVIQFAFLLLLLVGLALGIYKGFKWLRQYYNKEMLNNQQNQYVKPIDQSNNTELRVFSPIKQFWLIQHAFADADLTVLKSLLGPDIIDEATQNLKKCVLDLRNISCTTLVETDNECSIHYTFFDEGNEVNQVWHYEKFNGQWKLNGIENL